MIRFSERRHEAIRLIKNVRVYDDLELMLDGEAPILSMLLVRRVA